MNNTNTLELERLIKMPLPEILVKANNIRKENTGLLFETCSIVNAKSGLCAEDCKFCAQSSRYNTEVNTYSLKSENELVEAAKTARKIGARKFGLVTSGNCLNERELRVIANAIQEIRTQVGIEVCASLGALTRTELRQLKDAGLSRYHHNIETSPNYYKKIVTTHDFRTRVDTVKAAKEVGLETCCGGIIGLGESWEDRVEMAHFIKELDVDAIPLNLLVPIKGTPLMSAKRISCLDAIRTIAIFRLILPDKTIKIAAGRESILKDFQALGFMAGANGMLIGGYLTVRGREVAEDHQLIDEIKKLWTE